MEDRGRRQVTGVRPPSSTAHRPPSTALSSPPPRRRPPTAGRRPVPRLRPLVFLPAPLRLPGMRHTIRRAAWAVAIYLTAATELTAQSRDDLANLSVDD